MTCVALCVRLCCIGCVSHCDASSCVVMWGAVMCVCVVLRAVCGVVCSVALYVPLGCGASGCILLHFLSCVIVLCCVALWYLLLFVVFCYGVFHCRCVVLGTMLSCVALYCVVLCSVLMCCVVLSALRYVLCGIVLCPVFGV